MHSQLGYTMLKLGTDSTGTLLPQKIGFVRPDGVFCDVDVESFVPSILSKTSKENKSKRSVKVMPVEVVVEDVPMPVGEDGAA